MSQTTQRERDLLVLITLLQIENEALRSVLSEWDEPKDCYIQFTRAEACRDAIEVMECRL